MSTTTTALPVAETIYTSETTIPGNIAISEDGRIFISINPLLRPDVKLYEMLSENEITPFPDAEYSSGDGSIIKGALGINVDQHHRLWILDMVAQKFYVWDLRSHTLQESFTIDHAVTRPNSFLQDFAIDEKRRRIFIADMTYARDENEKTFPALIMIDMVTHKMTRLLENHETVHAEIENGFGLNPISIDPNSDWLYYGAVHSHKLYRIALDNFDDDAISYLEDSIELYAPKSFCDGIIVDNSENVYITNIEDNAIGLSNVSGFRNIATIPEGQSWPDGLALYNGHVYATLSQLDKSVAMNKNVDLTTKPYMVVRAPMVNE